MSGSQLPLFQRKTYKGIISTIPIEMQAPGADKTVIETLPAYYTYLVNGGFSKYTPDDFTGDLKKFGVYLKEKQIKNITDKDIQLWRSFLKAPSPRGEGLSAKTVSRKLTALGNYFQWLVGNEVIASDANPMLAIANTRVSSPLPEILFETECTALLVTASHDPRTYCQVQSLAAARAAAAAGAHVLVAQGNEAGGHTGALHLLPFLVRVVEMFPELPVVAAGGIASGRSLAAVLAAGAEGAWVGTAFVATPENELPDAYKARIVQCGGDESVYTEVRDIVHTRLRGSPPWPAGIAARVHNNAFIRTWHGREDALRAQLDEIIPMYAEAMQRGDQEVVPVLFGRSADFVHAVRPAADVLTEMCDTAERCLRGRWDAS